MKKFDAVTFNENEIILSHGSDLEHLFEIIEMGENFIVVWTEDGKEKSKLVIGNMITGKVKNGELVLTSEQKIGE